MVFEHALVNLSSQKLCVSMAQTTSRSSLIRLVKAKTDENHIL